MSSPVYTTAGTDADTITPCIGVPATYIIKPGRSLRAEVFNLFYTVDPTDIPSSGGGPP